MFNDNLVAGAFQDGSLAIFDIQTKKLQFKLSEHQSAARGLCFSPVSQLLVVSVGQDRAINFYDIQ